MLKETADFIEEQKRRQLRKLEQRVLALAQKTVEHSQEEVEALRYRAIDWNLIRRLPERNGHIRLKTILKMLRGSSLEIQNKIDVTTDYGLLFLYEKQMCQMDRRDLRKLGGYKHFGPATFKLVESYLQAKGFLH